MKKRQMFVFLVLLGGVSLLSMALWSSWNTERKKRIVWALSNDFSNVIKNESHTTPTLTHVFVTSNNSQHTNTTQETVTSRPLKCQNCLFANFPNLTQVPEVCFHGNGTSKPELVMMITSAVDSLDARNAIRETWASVTKKNTAHIRHVFLLGTKAGEGMSDAVRQESEKYKDVLVSDFVDSYRNLTYKSLVALHFYVKHCSHVRFFLKTDEDMYVFPQRVLNTATQYETALQTSVGGYCLGSKEKPWRKPATKYYVSFQMYPQKTYPGFCSGTGYIGSQNLARTVVEAYPNVPFFFLEDVYIGLVLHHVGFKFTSLRGFMNTLSACKNKWNARQTVTIHQVPPDEIRKVWNDKLCDG